MQAICVRLTLGQSPSESGPVLPSSSKDCFVWLCRFGLIPSCLSQIQLFLRVPCHISTLLPYHILQQYLLYCMSTVLQIKISPCHFSSKGSSMTAKRLEGSSESRLKGNLHHFIVQWEFPPFTKNFNGTMFLELRCCILLLAASFYVFPPQCI